MGLFIGGLFKNVRKGVDPFCGKAYDKLVGIALWGGNTFGAVIACVFHLHGMVKIQPFYSAFPLAEFIAKAFRWLFRWNFKEKSINRFLGRVVN